MVQVIILLDRLLMGLTVINHFSTNISMQDSYSWDIFIRDVHQVVGGDDEIGQFARFHAPFFIFFKSSPGSPDGRT